MLEDLNILQHIRKNSEFHSVIMTSYSIDLYYFENQIMRLLKQKGIVNINVLVDQRILDETLGSYTLNLKYINSGYSVSGIQAKGVFHPKIIFLVGENEVMLIQGSGNLTSGGHGKNHETFTQLSAGSDDVNALNLITEAWQYLKNLSSGVKGFTKDKINWIENNCNLLSEKKIRQKNNYHKISTDHELALLYNGEKSLLNQLFTLVPAHEITKVNIISPFYDDDGKLLSQLCENYSNAKFDVFLSENNSRHPFKMPENSRVSFYAWEDTERSKKLFKNYKRSLHAKIFIFNSKTEQYILTGSPNATVSAFGSLDNSGRNQEFAVLYKILGRNLLPDLGVTGHYKKIDPVPDISVHDDSIHENLNARTILINGADFDGKKIIIHSISDCNKENIILKIFDIGGEIIHNEPISKIENKLVKDVSSLSQSALISYLQFFDSYENIISNKCLINNVLELWNTNPSSENRRLIRLTYLIEKGETKLLSIIDFFNTIHTEKNDGNESVGTNNSSTTKKNLNAVDDGPGYHDILFEQPTEIMDELSHHGHPNIKIWDAIESFVKNYYSELQNEYDDEEERGTPEEGRIRNKFSGINNDAKTITESGLKKHRKSVKRFLSNYRSSLLKIQLQNHSEIGIVELAMLLIVLNQINEMAGESFIIKDSNTGEQKILPMFGSLSEMDSFAGAVINITGEIVNLFLKTSWKSSENDYVNLKTSHYKSLCSMQILFYLAVLSDNCKVHISLNENAEVLALNVIKLLGKPDDRFYKNFKILSERSGFEIESVEGLVNLVEKWILMENDKSSKANIFYDSNVGYCLVRKYITPSNCKYLKLSRPGFTYNTIEKDFVKPELYEFQNKVWVKSKTNISS